MAQSETEGHMYNLAIGSAFEGRVLGRVQTEGSAGAGRPGVSVRGYSQRSGKLGTQTKFQAKPEPPFSESKSAFLAGSHVVRRSVEAV